MRQSVPTRRPRPARLLILLLRLDDRDDGGGDHRDRVLRDPAHLERPSRLQLLGDNGLLAVFFLFPRVTCLFNFIASVFFLLFLLALVRC